MLLPFVPYAPESAVIPADRNSVSGGLMTIRNKKSAKASSKPIRTNTMVQYALSRVVRISLTGVNFNSGFAACCSAKKVFEAAASGKDIVCSASHNRMASFIEVERLI